MDTCHRTTRARAAFWTLVTLLAMSGCSTLLPDAKNDSEAPWKTYAEAETVFANIVPGKTTVAEMKAMGIDPLVMPNVSVLSHADLLRRLQALVTFEGELLDPAIRRCVAARQACYAFRIEQERIDRKREGNFWVDFLNFRRTTHVTGWNFDAMILINNGVVAYKSWTGKPNIRAIEQEHHPLGPLQGIGTSLLR